MIKPGQKGERPQGTASALVLGLKPLLSQGCPKARTGGSHTSLQLWTGLSSRALHSPQAPQSPAPELLSLLRHQYSRRDPTQHWWFTHTRPVWQQGVHLVAHTEVLDQVWAPGQKPRRAAICTGTSKPGSTPSSGEITPAPYRLLLGSLWAKPSSLLAFLQSIRSLRLPCNHTRLAYSRRAHLVSFSAWQ